MDQSNYYKLFIDLANQYQTLGYDSLYEGNDMLNELESLMELNNQFLYLGEMIKLDILFTSKRCYDMLGIAPKDMNLNVYFDLTHPDDLNRIGLGRAKLIKMSHDLFVQQKGHSILSSNIRMKNPTGVYSNYLMQNYLFYSDTPYRTVYIIKLQTNIDRFPEIKHGFHYYYGTDLTKFRYPDADLLKEGFMLSDREFDIIRCVHKGMSSEDISKKLFLSVHTVNTHRRNILNKTCKSNMAELTFALQESGVL